jgi:hypothetical protein
MVTLIVSLKGKPKQTLSFPGDETKTTIKDVKAAVQAKFPHVSQSLQALLYILYVGFAGCANRS